MLARLLFAVAPRSGEVKERLLRERGETVEGVDPVEVEVGIVRPGVRMEG